VEGLLKKKKDRPRAFGQNCPVFSFLPTETGEGETGAPAASIPALRATAAAGVRGKRGRGLRGFDSRPYLGTHSLFLSRPAPSPSLSRALPSLPNPPSQIPHPKSNPRRGKLQIGVKDRPWHELLPGVRWNPSSSWGRSPFKVNKLELS